MKAKPVYKSTTGREQIMELYEKVLLQWPMPCEHVTVSTKYGNTFVIACGKQNARPMILLHGSGSNSATWAADVIEYSKHFCVYAVDIPGEPGKSDENRFSWDGPQFNEWLDDVLNGLNLDKVILGGISLGAWATIKYASANPNRVDTVILICPAGVHRPKYSFFLRVMVLSLLGDWGLQRIKHLIFRDTPISEDAERFFVLTSKYFNFRVGAPPLFTDDELRQMTMPVFYLVGEEDARINTRKTAERLQKLAPNLQVNLMKDEGHAAINMAPKVLSFIESAVPV